jgi:PTS system cellobiose-specific IIA component
MGINEEMERSIFTIISCAGRARSICFEALRHAREGAFEQAEALLDQAQAELVKTHGVHAAMIQKEASGDRQEVSLLLVHAEDHLMNTLFAKDLIREMVLMLKQTLLGEKVERHG